MSQLRQEWDKLPLAAVGCSFQKIDALQATNAPSPHRNPSAAAQRSASSTAVGASRPPTPQTFYTYENSEGRIVIVDSLDLVPSAARPTAERVTAGAPASQGLGASWLPPQFDAPSFGLGVGSALLAMGLLSVLARSRRIMGALLGLGVAVLAAAVYLGWLRRTTGSSQEALLASPEDIIRDAQRAVERAKSRQVEQERVIEQIQDEAKH